MNPRFRALTLGGFFTYVFVGLFYTLVGPLIPAIRDEFGLSHGEAAAAILYQCAGAGVAVLLAGAVADRADRRRLIAGNFFALGFCLCAFIFVDAWSAVLAFFLLLGLGFGFGETVLNALFMDLNHGSEGKGLNALHAAPAAGGILGAPFAAALLPWGWRAPLAVLGVVLLAGATWLLIASYPPRLQSRLDGGGFGQSFRSIALHPGILIVAVLFAAYVGVEGSLNSWTVTYSLESLGASAAAGSVATSLFWLGLAAGRVACSAFAAPGRYGRILVASSLGAAIAYAPVLVFPSLLTLTCSIFAAGLALGGLFPTALAYAGTLFPERPAAVTGFLFLWCTVGGGVVPAAVGLIADRWGMQAGMAAAWSGILLLIAITGTLAAYESVARRLQIAGRH